MIEIPEELKIKDHELIETLWKLVVNYKALREELNTHFDIIKAMVADISFIIDQTLEHRLREESSKYHLKLVNTFKLARRLKGVEEELDGFLIHYTGTLKELRQKVLYHQEYSAVS